MNVIAEFKPSPELLAELFVNLDSDDMARFFAHAQRTVDADGDWSAGGIYAQALFLKDTMPVGSTGARFLMDLAAPWFVHTLMYIDANGERERA